MFLGKLMAAELKKKRPIFNSADALFCHVPSDVQRTLLLPAYKQAISILQQGIFTHSFQHQSPQPISRRCWGMSKNDTPKEKLLHVESV